MNMVNMVAAALGESAETAGTRGARGLLRRQSHGVAPRASHRPQLAAVRQEVRLISRTSCSMENKRESRRGLVIRCDATVVALWVQTFELQLGSKFGPS